MFLLVLLLVQFNICIAFKPRAEEVLGLPLTTGETCHAKVHHIGHQKHKPTKACKVNLRVDECVQKIKNEEHTIKDCPQCSCLNGRTTDIYVKVPKINLQLVERISKSNTFQLAGLRVPDALFHVTISVVGISILGLVAYVSPTALFLGPLIALIVPAVIWLILFGIGFLLNLVFDPPIERKDFEETIVSFLYAMALSIHVLLLPFSATWSFPDHLREKEIAAIEEKVHAFGLEDLLFA